MNLLDRFLTVWNFNEAIKELAKSKMVPIRSFLKAGVMDEGLVRYTEEGVPQGSKDTVPLTVTVTIENQILSG